MRTPMQGIIIVPDDDDDFPATICTVASPDGCPSERRPDRPLRRCHICGGRPPPRRFCPASHVACLACGKAGQLLPCLRVSTSVATTRPWEAQQPFHPRRIRLMEASFIKVHPSTALSFSTQSAAVPGRPLSPWSPQCPLQHRLQLCQLFFQPRVLKKQRNLCLDTKLLWQLKTSSRPAPHPTEQQC